MGKGPVVGSKADKYPRALVREGQFSSDLTIVSKVNFVLTWVTFQDAPAVKIDFKCTRKG